MANTRHVRIRPGRKGFKVKRYCYKGTIYDAARGWYQVPLHLANELAELHQDEYDEESPLLFDVVTKERAAEIDENEKAAVERATAEAPNQVEPGRRRTVITRAGRERVGGDLTTADLPENQHDEDAPMLDPDPDGAELEATSELGEGVVPVGRVTPDEQPQQQDAAVTGGGRVRHRGKKDR